MALKRKRSTPNFSSPFSDNTSSDSGRSSSPLPFFYAQSKPIEPLYQKATWSFPTYSSSDNYEHDHRPTRHLLNSRTRKRHRDNRPDELSIHGASKSLQWIGAVICMSTLADVCRCAASTISRLYEAQRQHPNAEPMPSQTNAASLKSEHATNQRSTLHSFWNIGSAPTPVPLPVAFDSGPRSMISSDMRCEDCDGALRQDDAMELDDGAVEQESECYMCRRRVCDRCAVLGHERTCLGCASR